MTTCRKRTDHRPMDGHDPKCANLRALPENKVLDVSGASTSNGANVQLYAANGTNAQKWVK